MADHKKGHEFEKEKPDGNYMTKIPICNVDLVLI